MSNVVSEVKNEVSNELQELIDLYNKSTESSLNSVKSTIDKINKESADFEWKTPSVSLSDYLKFPSVDISLSNIISSTSAAVGSCIDAISGQISVVLSPLCMLDFSTSALILSVQQTYDDIKQEISKKIDQTISALEKTVKTVVKTINGKVMEVADEVSPDAIGKKLNESINSAISMLKKLGLDSLMSGLKSLSSVTNSLTSMDFKSLTSSQTTALENAKQTISNSATTAKSSATSTIKGSI